MALEGGWTACRWCAGAPLTWVENHIYRVADGQLAAGPVVFTDYLQIASNQSR
jgi:hypothetical protein